MISETELRQVAYIFKCSKSTLQIKGKINSITIGRAELWVCTYYDKLLCINMLNEFSRLFFFFPQTAVRSLALCLTMWWALWK